MFGSFFKGMQEASMAVKVVQILQRNYRLTVPPHDVNDAIQRMQAGDSFGPDEMAVLYLSDWVSRMYKDHPKSKEEVVKYIRVAKMAHKNGHIGPHCLEALTYSAKFHFDIDATSIVPAAM